MRRFWALLAFLTALLAAGLWITSRTSVGATLAHYNLSFALLVLAAAPAWPWLRRRRVATLAMAYMGIVATITGFAMLYTRQFPLKEWITWWHSVTSFAFMLAFLVHWFLNNARLVDFTKRTLRRASAAAPAIGAWLGIAGAFWLTWSPAGRDLFTRENYLHLATWAVFIGIALTWGIWLAFRHPRLRERLSRAPSRRRSRALVDTSLFLACWASLLTGFVLLYFAGWFDANGFKYVSKWWHTATSVALLGLVALHIGFNARLLAAHARRVDREVGSPPERPDAPADTPEG